MTPKKRGYRYFRYDLTGKGSISTPESTWRQLSQTSGVENFIMIDGHGNIVVKVKADKWQFATERFGVFGEVTEITENDYRESWPPVP